jgi:predicted transcriptional regulator
MHGDGARVTNVATRANLSYDRLMEYLDELARQGFITPGRMPQLTEKGNEFLRAARQWRGVLGRFGLD